MTAEYLSKLNFSYCPDGIMAKNDANVSSTIEREWIESVAKIKKVTNLDTIGFDIRPDPTNHTRRHVFLGAPREVRLL